MQTAKHIITLGKDAERQLNDRQVDKQIQAIVSGTLTAGRKSKGWDIEIQKAGYHTYSVKPKRNPRTYNLDGYAYTVNLAVSYQSDKERNGVETEFQNICQAIAVKGNAPKWNIVMVDSKEWSPPTSIEVEVASKNDVGYAHLEIPDTWMHNFAHLYGLDDHIMRVQTALEAAIESGWRHRFHCALIGPPGCGKSDICQSVKRALGEESVLEFDATSTTMAGAQKELAEREELPRVIIIEEIEKAPESSLAWLLSILDLRSEIRKTTARGNIYRDTKMLAIATVNDLPTFQKVNFGALQSRFANKVFFKRPSRELLTKILKREILFVRGNEKWVEPTLNYAEEIGTTDPREVISIALCGRDMLLDGSYQEALKRTRQEKGA